MGLRSWSGPLAVLALGGVLGIHVAVAADPPSENAKAAEKPKATIKSAMADVGDMSVEMRKIEKRLGAIEQSVSEINAALKRVESMDKSMAGMNASLVPVGELTRPEGLDSLVKEVSDVAYDRGVALILIATACAGVLLVLLAFLFRWSRRPLPVEIK